MKSVNAVRVQCSSCRWTVYRVWREAEGYGVCHRCDARMAKMPKPFSAIRQKKIEDDFARTGR